MKKLIYIAFLCSVLVNLSWGQIVEAEYFVDFDPGVGLATALSVNGPVNSLDTTFSIPTDNLQSGLHVLHIRAKDNNGMWSLYSRRYFFIQQEKSNPVQQQITRAEYFIDSDPGVGLGTELNITSGLDLNTSFNISTLGIDPGLHVLHIRTETSDGIWSLYTRQYFFIHTESIDVTETPIISAEYFIDSDPGVGNGTVLGISQGSSISESFSIPTGLDNGLHVLHIRTKNESGIWSLYERQYFFVHSISSDPPTTPIVEAEYFFDSDPGVGLGMAIDLSDGFTVDETISIPIPIDMPEGDYTLHIRVKDESGTWSLYLVEPMTVGALDTDEDGVLDIDDNCVETPNPNQEDVDNDAIGDACDNCPNEANADQADADNDTVGDLCDVCPGFDDTIDADNDNYPEGCDCDDTNAGINAGATDIPDNGIDEDCDGLDLLTWHRDADGDGFGDPNSNMTSNTQPTGYVSDNTDCNDSEPLSFPGNTEVCDGIDNDCDGQIDEGVLLTFYADADGDGFGNPNDLVQACAPPSGYVSDNTDCNDNEALSFPGNSEVCDGIDNDCNGVVDDGVLLNFYADADGDGFGNPNDAIQACSAPTGYVSDNTDCNDSEALSFPGNSEVCDGIDNDCDGEVDEGVLLTFYADADGDGFGNPNDMTQACSAPEGYIDDNTDCDDSEGLSFPGNSEVCDGIDNDCDGEVDEGVLLTFYADNDGDGYGNPDMTTQACSAPEGYVDDNTDCNDSEALSFPGNTEVCDGIDNDCDGEVDEGVLLTFYADNDGDGFGNPDVTIQACSAPDGYVDDNTDCNDGEALSFPGNTEICDGIDNDCDGEVDEGVLLTFYVDADGDGFGSTDDITQACSAPDGYVDNNTDCDDGNANVYPGRSEIPNDGIDQDCDGSDLVIPDTDGDGVLDDTDNCIDEPNPDQSDSDNDGIGDACDMMGVIVPQGFSPNGDGINDTWVIENLTSYSNNVKVFNRWGNLVFETNDYQNNWDGTSSKGGSSGRLPVGPYLYVITFSDTSMAPLQGWIYINY